MGRSSTTPPIFRAVSRQKTFSMPAHGNDQMAHEALRQPLIGIHDLFNQQAQAFELGEVQLAHRLIESTIHPLAIALLVDGEVLLERVAPDSVGDAVLMREISGLELQAHRCALDSSRHADAWLSPLAPSLQAKMKSSEGL